ncbi:hypothetical protein [Priestia flexa]|nr:hypothetical protein [Priestia flexa]
MYDFILNMWVMRKADEEFVSMCFSKNYITNEEYDIILSTPQVSY